MGGVRFYLINKKNIAASYYCDDSRLVYSTGKTCTPEDLKSKTYSKSIRLHLDRIEQLISHFVDGKNKIGVPVLKSELKDYLDSNLYLKREKKANTFFEDYEQMMEDMRNGKILHHTDKRYSERSIKHYKSIKYNLTEFETWAGIKLSYAWDKKLHGRLMEYCVEMNYAKNTVYGITKDLSGFLRHMQEAGKHNNSIYKEQWFAVRGEETDQIALSDKEIEQIYKLDLTKDRFADNARDCFVLACYVGLRINDLRNLRRGNFRDDVIEVITQKTGEKVLIPMHWIVREIWNKYNGDIPRFKTPEALKYHLEDICKDAGLTDSVLIGKTKGGVMDRKHIPKYRLVSAHTARRSFATNGYLAGIPIPDLMKITGHRSIDSFMRYIRITKEENARRLALHPFFNKPIPD